MLFSMGAVETVKYEMVNLSSCLYELSGLHYGCQMEKEETAFMVSLLKSLVSQTNDNKSGENENSCFNINQYRMPKNIYMLVKSPFYIFSIFDHNNTDRVINNT